MTVLVYRFRRDRPMSPVGLTQHLQGLGDLVQKEPSLALAETPLSANYLGQWFANDL